MKRGTPDHPKTLWLKAGLGISKREVVGLLEMLFHFTARCSPQGNIGKWTNAQIAEALEWTGDADALVMHITDAGFIDEDRANRLLVHDWPEHADNTTKKYLARNGLQFFGPARHVQTLSGQRKPRSGRRRPTVAVAVAVPDQALPSQRTPAPTDAPPPDPPGERAPVVPIEAALAWNREAADLWTAEYQGAPPKQFFGALKPLVKRETWERVRPALATYLAETPAEYVNVAGKFVAAFGTWVARSRGERAPPGRPSIGEQAMSETAKFLKAKGGIG